jgi:hypothetical protein
MCPKPAVGWLAKRQAKTIMQQTPCMVVTITDKAIGRAGNHPAIPLKKLTGLADEALLTIAVSIGLDGYLLGYNLGIQGAELGTTRRWYARVDLHEAPAGKPPVVQDGGYCNHAMLHCQFGADPNDRRERPSARSPLPWLMPWQALEWLLATVEPGLEPEPF